jgi:hypothetical protein
LNNPLVQSNHPRADETEVSFNHSTDLPTYEQLWTPFLVQVNHRIDLQLELIEISTFQGLGQRVGYQAMEAIASNLPATKHLFNIPK